MDMIAGVLLQYLRSMKRFPEWATVLVVVAFSCLSVYLGPGFTNAKDFLNASFQHALIMLGMTQATSTVANVAVSAGTPQNSPLVPVTDSL